jgi:type IV secretory pathway ATPase VirB11/archaellum biosynthesis ATPase
MTASELQVGVPLAVLLTDLGLQGRGDAAAELRVAAESGRSVMWAGGPAAGRTTLLRQLRLGAEDAP